MLHTIVTVQTPSEPFIETSWGIFQSHYKTTNISLWAKELFYFSGISNIWA